MADLLDVLTLTEAKDAIANNAGTGNDGLLALYVTGVSRYLDRVAGAVVIRTIASETLDGLGQSQIALRYRPVVSIESVTEYMGGTAYTLTQQSLGVRTANGYSADLRKGLLIRGSGYGIPWSADLWAPGRGNIIVAYTAGRYADTAHVDVRFKLAGQIILGNLWRKERGLAALPDGFLTGATYAMPHAAAALLADDLRPQARSVQMQQQ